MEAGAAVVIHGSSLAQHVPNNWQIRAKEAAEGLENGVGAEWYIIPSEVRASAAKDHCQTDGGNHTGSKTDTEDEAQEKFLLGLQLQVPDHGHRHEEDPYVRDQVRDIGEVCESDHCQACPSHTDVPVCL